MDMAHHLENLDMKSIEDLGTPINKYSKQLST